MLSHFVHNEYFYTIKRKWCSCGSKNQQVYGWGAFVNRKFHKITDFCSKCFEERIKENLIATQEKNHCIINIKGFRKEPLPIFLLELRDLLAGKAQIYLPLPTAIPRQEKTRGKTAWNSSQQLLFS